MIRRAAKVAATRVDAQTALITIEAGDVGHSFPTGDMFRRLELRAEAMDTSGVVIAQANPIVLARTFRDVPRDPTGRDFSMQRIAGSDSRIAPPDHDGAARPARISLKVTGAEPGSRIHWQVVYQRMSAPMAEAFQVSQVLDEIVVAEGVLAPFSSDSNSTIASVKED